MDNLNKINHFVVLMLENRSFDNVLGFLYDQRNAEPFKSPPRGQSLESLGNQSTLEGCRDHHGDLFTPGYGSTYCDPYPDPGEEFFHVNMQLYGSINPRANSAYPFNYPPYNLPLNVNTPNMQGFVLDFMSNYRASCFDMKAHDVLDGSPLPMWLKKIIARFVLKTIPKPKPEQYRIIMNCFTPQQLPIISTLAVNYAVCDHWFASVPTQTQPNRSFVHAATSHGYVINGVKFLLADSLTIFDRFHQAGVNWHVYYDKESILSLTGLLHSRIYRNFPEHFLFMEEFYNHAAAGTLPAYSL